MNAELRRVLTFAAIGSVNTAGCYALYALLVAFGWHYNSALVGSYAAGLLVGFALHRSATFADRTHLRQAFGKYAVTLVLTFAVNLVLLDLLVRGEQLTPLVAQALAMTVATLVSYRLQTHWVFRSHATQEEERDETPATILSLPQPERRAA